MILCKVVHNNVRKNVQHTFPEVRFMTHYAQMDVHLLLIIVRICVQKQHKMIKIILIAVYLIALFLFVKDMCKAPLVKIDEDDIY